MLSICPRGRGYAARKKPPVVICTIADPLPPSQSEPFDPVAMGSPPLTGYTVKTPDVVIRPICPSVPVLEKGNHSAPSGPATISSTLNGTGYSLITPAMVIRPILLASCSVNQSAPSGPTTIPVGLLFSVGMGYLVTTPAVVIRPIWSPAVNHSAASGPATM